MKFIKIITIFLLAILISFSFIGCNDGTDNLNNGGNNGNDNNSTFNTLVEFLTSLETLAQSNGSYSYTVKADETILSNELSYEGKTNITIILSGDNINRTISFSPVTAGRMFTVHSGVTLILGNNLTLAGHEYNSFPLIVITSGGKLIMNEGSKITGNTNTSEGGGVVVSSGLGINPSGIFIMNGGEISGNRSGTGGGGVAISSGAVFTMNNGKIINNRVTGQMSKYGGGVLVYGTFIMEGGEVSNNTVNASYGLVTEANGGGVYVVQSSFTMNGGKITGNTTTSSGTNSIAYGGGVFVNGSASYPGSFTMTGGEISGNSISGNSISRGGGVYLDSNTTITYTKTGGVITGSDDVIAPNIIKNNSGNLQNNNGFAVYLGNPARRRETTAGTNINMNSNTSGTEGGWEN